jgi:hypothetical protein
MHSANYQPVIHTFWPNNSKLASLVCKFSPASLNGFLYTGCRQQGLTGKIIHGVQVFSNNSALARLGGIIRR